MLLFAIAAFCVLLCVTNIIEASRPKCLFCHTARTHGERVKHTLTILEMIKKLELGYCDLTEMNSAELSEVDGGNIFYGIAAAFIISAMNNWGDIRQGYSDGASGAGPSH